MTPVIAPRRRQRRTAAEPLLTALLCAGISARSSAGDLNGDGFDELAVGSPSEALDPDNLTTQVGAASLLPGSAIGLLPDAIVLGFPQTLFVQEDVGLTSDGMDLFGLAFAFGDFNCDGDDEVAIGVPFDHDGFAVVSRVVVVDFDSQAATYLFTQIGLETLGFPQSAGPLLGNALVAAALDPAQPACDSLAIGAPRDRESGGVGEIVGAVYVIPGSPAGLDFTTTTKLTQGSLGLSDAPEAGDAFGESLAAGDLNADGFIDLVIGVPGESIDVPGVGNVDEAGALHVVPGCAAGIGQCGADLFLTQTSDGLTGPAEVGDRFGTVLAVGDHDGNEIDDLAIGTPGDVIPTVDEPTENGAVELVRGPILGPPFFAQYLYNDCGVNVSGCPRAAARFGAALVLDDFDASRPGMELAVGAPGYPGFSGFEPDQDGWVHIIPSSPLPRDLVLTEHSFFPGSFVVAPAGDFGSALASGDFDGNGTVDLAIGAPNGAAFDANGSSVVGGRVSVVPGDPALGLCLYCDGYGATPLRFTQGDIDIDNLEDGDQFGLVLGGHAQ